MESDLLEATKLAGSIVRIRTRVPGSMSPAFVPLHWSVLAEQCTEPCGLGWPLFLLRDTNRCQNPVGSKGRGFCSRFRPLSPQAVTSFGEKKGGPSEMR